MRYGVAAARPRPFHLTPWTLTRVCSAAQAELQRARDLEAAARRREAQQAAASAAASAAALQLRQRRQQQAAACPEALSARVGSVDEPMRCACRLEQPTHLLMLQTILSARRPSLMRVKGR